MVIGSTRTGIFAGLVVLAFGAAEAAPAALNTTDFLAACVGDPVVADEPGLAQGSKVTAQIYCQCVAGKFAGKKLSQSDVDMLTKMHKDEITDEDAESYPTLQDLMEANEGLEDACKESLGMPAAKDNGDEEGPPIDEENIPQDE
jgi:hypothetical protein